MSERRSDGPGPNKIPSVNAMRRAGVRREVSERVILRNEEGKTLEGWALNVSRGGLRIILEERVLLGQKFEVVMASEEGSGQKGRVVWVQEEPDGVIVGIEFLGVSGSMKAGLPPSSDE